MNWTTIWQALTGAGLLGLLALLGTFTAWVLGEVRRRQVRVRGLVGEWKYFLSIGGSKPILSDETIRLSVFNGLPVEVGMHQLVMAARKRRWLSRTPKLGSPALSGMSDGLPESVPSQMSAIIELDARAMKEAAARSGNETGYYRLELTLGNGQVVTSKWQAVGSLLSGPTILP